MYTVYKTTNLINGKFYIGVHKTNNPYDEYLGSGKLIKRALLKYGAVNFKKEILLIADYAVAAFEKEKELLDEQTLKNPLCYNLKHGGEGGFDLINKHGLNVNLNEQRRRDPTLARRAAIQGFKRRKELWENDSHWHEVESERLSKAAKERFRKVPSIFNELNKSEAFQIKRKQGLKAAGAYSAGEKNSQYGTCWITNGIENKKIPKEEVEQWSLLGWVKGRNM